MECELCGIRGFIMTPWGPIHWMGFVCRGTYPLYEEHGLHVVKVAG
jgi:hypothetical protein